MANTGEAAKKAGEALISPKTATILSAASLGVGGINLCVNARRGSNEKKFQKDQIGATRDLTNALKEDSKNLKKLRKSNNLILFRESQKPYTQDPIIPDEMKAKFRPKRKRTRQKQYSILGSTLRGAAIGGTLGGGVTLFRKREQGKDEYGSDKDWLRKKRDNIYATKWIGGGMLAGAALGALVGTVLEVSKKSNRSTTVDARLMEHVIRDLKSKGFKEGTQFTRDPKQATEMKSKVCIVISKYSGELRLLINVVKDPKLENVTTQIIKNIPNSSNVVTREGDKFNDIIVSTISDGSADAQLIAGIAEKFIHNKYPVYLVEVG